MFKWPFHVADRMIDSPRLTVWETTNIGWIPASGAQALRPSRTAKKPLQLGARRTVMSCWLLFVSVKVMTPGWTVARPIFAPRVSWLPEEEAALLGRLGALLV